MLEEQDQAVTAVDKNKCRQELSVQMILCNESSLSAFLPIDKPFYLNNDNSVQMSLIVQAQL